MKSSALRVGLGMVCAIAAQVAIGGLRENFAMPQGTARENTGPLFWMHGTYAGGFIGAPYRIDITRAVKPGANTLEAKPFHLVQPKIVVAE